jgi:hypothetical protein
MKAPKFIIINGTLVMGVVDYHKDLIDKSLLNPDVIGGGRFLRAYAEQKHYILFYGKSEEFGKIRRADFELFILTDKSLKDQVFIFSDKEYASDAIAEAKALVGEKRWR